MSNDETTQEASQTTEEMKRYVPVDEVLHVLTQVSQVMDNWAMSMKEVQNYLKINTDNLNTFNKEQDNNG